MENVALSGQQAAIAIEQPVRWPADNRRYGSDVIAETIRALNIEFVALTPGSSFRGLHDSLVNHLGNREPQLLVCLHEEHAIAIAHGYAKVTGRLMAAAVHANIGLMHASMAIYNAWCDREPVLVIGATGPVDAMRRRPWIDWIHTSRDQGALVRPFLKWDDQPASAGAAREALVRAAGIAETLPKGPVYVNLDSEMQEAPLDAPLTDFETLRYRSPVDHGPSLQAVRDTAARLRNAKNVLFLMGRFSRSEGDWANRIELAERVGARVATDLKVGAAFPTDHCLHMATPFKFMNPELAEAIKSADIIIAFEWVDLAGTLSAALGYGKAASAHVVHASLDHTIHNGWSLDHQALAPVDLHVACAPDLFVEALLQRELPARKPVPKRSEPAFTLSAGPQIGVSELGRTLRAAVGERDACLIRLPLSWDPQAWAFRHPLDYLGSDGGGGLASGPGMAVGGALALKGTGRLPIAILGDGDFLMGGTAVWTAVHYELPLLIVIANNQSYYNDELHQERVARTRARPAENRWIGQRLADPPIDLSAFAKSQGAKGFGPVTDRDLLEDVLRQAIAAVEAGGVAVVDVHVAPGYEGGAAANSTQSSPASKD
ncbi:thiamine pyrophosphate-binding protein [Neorhizobium sp. DT-125]|uniref:thiamine pyrophosphate-binding protein n=1 Tax=Neorhizobium sp. DT-125 TaxID=3396163 RepID=UPI003F1DB897